MSVKDQWLALERWDALRRIGESSASKLAGLFPIFGQILILSDRVKGFIVGADGSIGHRLYFTFYGLFLFGIGSLLYQVWCPALIREHASAEQFVLRAAPAYGEKDYELAKASALELGVTAVKDLMTTQAWGNLILREFYEAETATRPLRRRVCLVFFALGLASLSIPSAEVVWAVTKRAALALLNS